MIVNPQITLPFINPDNYNFDLVKIVIDGKAKLKLLQASQIFNEDFIDDTDFVYDNTKAEFVNGKIQQKDLFGGTFYAEFATKLNATYANGLLVHAKTGTVNLLDGKAEFPSGVNNFLSFDSVGNADQLINQGTIRFWFTPNYSGDGTGSAFFSIAQDQNQINNLVRISHIGTVLRWDVYDSSGSSIKTVQTGNSFSPTANQEYEIELNFDVIAGEYRLFIDGILINGLQTSAPGTRTNSINLFRVGKNYLINDEAALDGSIRNFQMFNSVQHIANYTPFQVPSEFRYNKSNIQLPEFTHVGIGEILSYLNLVITEGGSPKYLLKRQLGNFKYWDGSIWTDSNLTYQQANDKVTFSDNLFRITNVTDTTCQILILFDDTDILTLVDDLTLNYIGHTGYDLTNPTVQPKMVFQSDKIISISESVVFAGSDTIRYAIKVDGSQMWWNGSIWTTSSNYAETNTIDELNANFSTLTVVAYFTVIIYFHSDAGLTTPELEEISIEFQYKSLDNQENVGRVTVVGYMWNVDDTPDLAGKVSARLFNNSIQHETGNSIVSGEKSVVTDSEGGYAITLVPSDELNGQKYLFTFTNSSGKKDLRVRTVNQSSPIEGKVKFDDLIY